MSTNRSVLLEGVVVEEQLHLTVTEICQACSITHTHIEEWVAEGVLQPQGRARVNGVLRGIRCAAPRSLAVWCEIWK